MAAKGISARRAFVPWLLLAPCLTALALVAAYPLWRTLSLSFTDAYLLEPDAPVSWVGLDNYRDLWADPDWWNAVRNTLWFTGISVTLETLLGLGIALLVHSEMRGRGAMRAAMLIPWAIPTVVAAQMWRWMFNDVYGVINDLCSRVGIDRLFVSLGIIERPPIAWLAAPNLVLPTIIAVDVWKTTPFMALLLLAGLQSIPRSTYEAAEVDGAGRWHQFWRITMPLLRPALVVALIFRTLDALRVFDVIYVMTPGNPDTESVSVYARRYLVDFGELGIGSAASTAIFLLIAIFSIAYLTALRTEVD